jgi:DNA-binding transcriptional LysR family regulator
VPTSVGQQLLDEARDVLARVDSFEQLANQLKSDDVGMVRLTCHPGHVERFVAKVVADFRRKHPNIGVVLVRIADERRAGAGRAMFDDLSRGAVDFAIGAAEPRPRTGSTPLFESRIVLVVPDEHPWRDELQISIDQLRGLPLLVAPSGYVSRERLEAAARIAGMQLTVAAETSSPIALLALGKSGQGLPVISDEYGEVGRAERPYPSVSDSHHQALTVPVALHWREEGVSSAEQKFIDHMKSWADTERREPRAAVTDVSH